MSLNFNARAPLRQADITELLGDPGETRDRLLGACLGSLADEARLAAAAVLQRTREKNTVDLSAALEDGDVQFTLDSSETDIGGKPCVLMAACWEVSPEDSLKPRQVMFAIHPDERRPATEWRVELRVSAADDSTVEVDLASGRARRKPDLMGMLGSIPMEAWLELGNPPWVPLTGDGLRLVVGASVELLQRASQLAKLAEGPR